MKPIDQQKMVRISFGNTLPFPVWMLIFCFVGMLLRMPGTALKYKSESLAKTT